MTATVTPASLKRMLHDGQELALLDVREDGSFAQGHLLFSTSLPLSRLELHIRQLVPRYGTRIVLCDDADGLAERAGGMLTRFGYTDMALLAGGNRGWQAVGYVLFSGVNVPSKAFGEFIEHTYRTPSISAEDLRRRMQHGEDLVILDSRPMEEYTVMNIPGGVNVPGGELVYRVHEVAPDANTLVVVNCAGRTRSIIGTQSLINSGLRNEIVALRNGTMGWRLAGYGLEHGKRRRAPEVSARGLTQAQEAAARVAKRFGVRTVDPATLDTWQAEAQTRSLYVLDVRLPEEYEAGHLPAARNAPGGQLIQAADGYMATRGARVVLVDDNGVRATLTASWLIQMGWREVYVLDGGMQLSEQSSEQSSELVSGPYQPEIAGLAQIDVPEITTGKLAQALEAGADGAWIVVDLASSRQYNEGHIPDAWFAIRSQLAEALTRLPNAARIVLTSPDGVLARLAAPELQAAHALEVKVLRGGTDAWRAEGRPLEQGAKQMASEPVDVWLKPYERPGGVEDAMESYLAWEVGLVRQIEQDGDADFKAFP